uniref:Uncharacterized protein n=1 Tax=Spongospora subterranea TaxID=70186 RepID=A0A0H5QTA9_9EUKA|eukprot:CRZ04952.1 hypothetical protein [Spongospora subterranea]
MDTFLSEWIDRVWKPSLHQRTCGLSNLLMGCVQHVCTFFECGVRIATVCAGLYVEFSWYPDLVEIRSRSSSGFSMRNFADFPFSNARRGFICLSTESSLW